MVSFGPEELGTPLSADELPRIMSGDSQQGQKHGSASPEHSATSHEALSPGPTVTQSVVALTSAASGSKSKPRRINPTILSTFSASGGAKAADQAKEAGPQLRSKEVPSSSTEERSVPAQSKPEACQKTNSLEETPLAASGGCGGGAERARDADGDATSPPPSDGRDVTAKPRAPDKTNPEKQPRRVDLFALSLSPGLAAQPGHSKPAGDGSTPSAVLHKLPETGQSSGGSETGDLQTCADEAMEVQIIE